MKSYGQAITFQHGKLTVSNAPRIPYIIGDGIGEDIWRAAQPVLDAAIAQAYAGRRHLDWWEVLAGEKALAETRSLLPEETIQAFRECHVGIKGPLTTPVGGGFRSLNVALRKTLDLYACVRPVRWIPGVPSPVWHPEKVSMIVFRENTEDIYTGIEFQAGSELNHAFQSWLQATAPEEFAKIRFPGSSGISIKPISKEGSQRLIRAAIRYALDHQPQIVTLVHKGNIMKFTEGAFATWGYDLAENEFPTQVYTQRQYQQTKTVHGEAAADQQKAHALASGKLWLNEVITDAAFEQTLTRPEEFDVIATMNLNGDYLSDALTAQVGGLGIAPGVNLNSEEGLALFEATHGTAPTLAGKNCANPCSLILSGALMLSHMGWHEAADLVETALRATLADKIVTFDFKRLMPEATVVSTTGFGEALIQHMHLTTHSES